MGYLNTNDNAYIKGEIWNKRYKNHNNKIKRNNQSRREL